MGKKCMISERSEMAFLLLVHEDFRLCCFRVQQPNIPRSLMKGLRFKDSLLVVVVVFVFSLFPYSFSSPKVTFTVSSVLFGMQEITHDLFFCLPFFQ
jgi:hypothetical protein